MFGLFKHKENRKADIDTSGVKQILPPPPPKRDMKEAMISESENVKKDTSDSLVSGVPASEIKTEDRTITEIHRIDKIPTGDELLKEISEKNTTPKIVNEAAEQKVENIIPKPDKQSAPENKKEMLESIFKQETPTVNIENKDEENKEEVDLKLKETKFEETKKTFLNAKGPVFISMKRYKEVMKSLIKLKGDIRAIEQIISDLNVNKDLGATLLKKATNNVISIEESVKDVNVFLKTE